jgi:hypothetical protein
MSSSDQQSNPTTNNVSQDRRNAVQNGVGVSGNGNNVTSITTDDGAITGALNAATAAMTAALSSNSVVSTNAINTTGAIASNAITANGTVATNAVNAVTSSENQLANTGLAMLQANTSLASSLISSVMNAGQQTQQIAANLASQQVAASNDDKYLIVAGLAVVGIVGFMAMSRGKL